MANTGDELFVQEEIPIEPQLVRSFRIETVTGQFFELKNNGQALNGFKKFLLKYDHTGNRIHQQQYSRRGKTIYEWKYDGKGRALQEIAYETSGNTKYWLEYVYNHSDNWREKRMYHSSNKLHYRIVSYRDESGRILNGNYFDSSNQVIRKDSYIYDDRGRLVKMSMGQMGEWIYEYDENNNLRRKTGNLSSASIFGEDYEFLYDDRGLLMKKKHFQQGITVFKYSYFD